MIVPKFQTEEAERLLLEYVDSKSRGAVWGAIDPYYDQCPEEDRIAFLVKTFWVDLIDRAWKKREGKPISREVFEKAWAAIEERLEKEKEEVKEALIHAAQAGTLSVGHLRDPIVLAAAKYILQELYLDLGLESDFAEELMWDPDIATAVAGFASAEEVEQVLLSLARDAGSALDEIREGKETRILFALRPHGLIITILRPEEAKCYSLKVSEVSVPDDQAKEDLPHQQ